MEAPSEKERPEPRDAPAGTPEAAPAQGEAAREPAIDVTGSLIRCPYCRSEVTPERYDWVACRTCLARHHLACWREGKKCATCGETKYLAAKRTAAFVRDALGLHPASWAYRIGQAIAALAFVTFPLWALALLALSLSAPHVGIPTSLAVFLTIVLWKRIVARRREELYDEVRRKGPR